MTYIIQKDRKQIHSPFGSTSRDSFKIKLIYRSIFFGYNSISLCVGRSDRICFICAFLVILVFSVTKKKKVIRHVFIQKENSPQVKKKIYFESTSEPAMWTQTSEE